MNADVRPILMEYHADLIDAITQLKLISYVVDFLGGEY